jgi:acetyl esterase/lipase
LAVLFFARSAVRSSLNKETKMKIKTISFMLLSLLLAVHGNALSPFTVPLWPGTPPGALGTAEKDVPTLTVYLPDGATAACPAVVICPGGGYGHLSMQLEGFAVAQWLNSLGVAGIVLKYRLPGDGYVHPVPLRDAQRALRTVRSKTLKWKLDENRIAIMGFSAGGHLASTLGTHFLDTDKKVIDTADTLSCRPDLLILIYPVITMKQFAHMGSRNNLIGTNPDSALVEDLSNETRVTSGTPSAFLVHADDDKSVPAENSIFFYTAMRKTGVPAEMHIFKDGGHGFGMGKNQSVASRTWHLRLADWLRANGWIQ